MTLTFSGRIHPVSDAAGSFFCYDKCDMIKPDRGRTILRATLTMIGTIIGAGVFALPELFARVGLIPGTLLFLFVTGIVLATHVLYLEITLAVKKRMRLVGYAKQELGVVGHWISIWTYTFHIIGANLAYLMLGGGFLAILFGQLLPSWTMFVWQAVFWAFGSLMVFGGLRFVAKIESAAVWLLIGAMFVVACITLQSFDVSRAAVADWPKFFFPFGAFLFALSGFTAINEVSELVGRRRVPSLTAVVGGTLIAALLSWLFGIGMAYAGGGGSRLPETLMSVLPMPAAWLIPLVGFFAVITSFIMISEDMEACLHLDFALSRRTAWFVTILAPLAVLLTTQRDFIQTVGAVGAVFGGINGLLIAAIAGKMKQQKKISAPFMRTFAVVVATAYVLGIGYQLLRM